eukprot:CAMPEP_0198300806 /NCGR_PEP_ID=MMETSP1449-20131203/49539_1 /TAXON_ID=420275 /ORGANISM="Attheya septentrionalis, Strain CCMP2084" /LENGTH=50 /DNA_ID=CAMNT_0044002721 /DNA_START=19 /DNA_END=167 /DNA_ORIENTATION=+
MASIMSHPSMARQAVSRSSRSTAAASSKPWRGFQNVLAGSAPNREWTAPS